jgi:hypothetical protein
MIVNNRPVSAPKRTRLSASVPSRHTQFSVDFTTNIAESNFRYTQVIQTTQAFGSAKQRG